jgi:hypothetical protein
MPLIVRKHTFEKMCSLTKNYQYFYYHGAIMGIGDTYECVFLNFEFQDFSKLKEELNKFRLFMNDFLNRDKEMNDNFYIDFGYNNYKNDHRYVLLMEINGKLNYSDFSEEQFFIIERFEKIIEEYIKMNNLIPEIRTNDFTKFDKLSFERTWNPRHPDLNYMFLIKETEK